MSEPNNEPAFPIPLHSDHCKCPCGNTGMTIRDYIATNVLPVIVNDSDVAREYCAKALGIAVAEYDGTKDWYKYCAVEAYKHADAMLEARKQ